MEESMFVHVGEATGSLVDYISDLTFWNNLRMIY